MKSHIKHLRLKYHTKALKDFSINAAMGMVEDREGGILFDYMLEWCQQQGVKDAKAVVMVYFNQIRELIAPYIFVFPGILEKVGYVFEAFKKDVFAKSNGSG